jgi:5S rRNA maturation endonuclease (ribonuclease M5)
MLSPRALEILEELRGEQNLLIVEGIKDSIALKSMGFNKIITISGKPLEEVVEETISLKPQQVAILTDFDREGESIASYLNNLFSHYQIKLNHTIRKKFKSLKINKIEELNFFTKLMEDGQNGKISSIYYKIFNRSRILSRRNSGKTRRNRSDIWSDRRTFGSRSRFKRAPKDG